MFTEDILTFGSIMTSLTILNNVTLNVGDK